MSKYKILHLGWGNPKHKYRLGKEVIERKSEEKNLGVLANGKINMTWQCAFAVQKDNCILGCIKRNLAAD